MAIPFKTDSGDFGVLNITGSSSADFSAGINSSGANYLERVYFTGADGQWLPVDESADAWTSGSAGKLYYNGGNVGIGTNNPSDALSIHASNPYVKLVDSDVAAPAFLKNQNGNLYLQADTSQARDGSFIRFDIDSNQYVTISGSAALPRVGIGTQSPAHALTLFSAGAQSLGLSTAAGDHVKLGHGATPNGNIQIADAGGTNRVYLHSAASSYFRGGNVGIGTNDPSHLLSVSGTTYSQSLFVTGADGSWGQVTAGGGGSVSWDSAPATSTSAGAAGSIAYDSNYYYVCVATNTWKRTSLSSW